ncbi:MAG TPA: Ig-like domain-containing protein, partial [Gemmatimonadaceae bacterium]|nr:Ig-like domain-containing protein [Gemmatimonadaceae bacterium]
MNFYRAVCALVALGAIGGCGDSTSPQKSVPTSIVIVPPASTSLAGGASLQLVATVKDQTGTAMTGQTISWTSSDATRATVSQDGLVQGRLAGPVSISATSGALTSGVILTVVTGAASTIVKRRDVAAGTLVGASDSIAVTVLDPGGNPVSGVSVAFAVGSGGGHVSSATSTTGSDGVAGVTWTLGPTAGAQTATATAASLTGSPVQFSATALAGPAVQILKASTDSASLPVNANVDSIKVKVTDQFGNPKAGEVAIFAATAGGGTVSPTSVTTGADGFAAARWTLGSFANTRNTATATRAGFATPTITFSTTTSVAVVASLTIVGPRVVVLDSGATLKLDAVASDAGGTAVSGAMLTVQSRSPAVIAASGSITGAERGSTFVVVASQQTPSAKDSVFVTVAVPGGPVAITDLARLDLKADTTITIAITL